MGQYTDKMTQKYVKMSLFIRVVTHFGSNESNDSFGFFCVVASIKNMGIMFYCLLTGEVIT